VLACAPGRADEIHEVAAELSVPLRRIGEAGGDTLLGVALDVCAAPGERRGRVINANAAAAKRRLQGSSRDRVRASESRSCALMCGVFGIRSGERDVSRLAYFGLFALQHRGQEAAGIAVSDRGHLTVLREMGLVAHVFDEQQLQALPGEVAIGHTRYSTTGRTSGRTRSRSSITVRARTVALGHNGNLVNVEELRSELIADGVKLESGLDSEVIAA
jgi:hypothetical protein